MTLNSPNTMQPIPVYIISDIVSNYYGLTTKVIPLSGYDEINFLLIDTESTKYILKLSTVEHNLNIIEAQVDVLALLAETSIAQLFPKCIKTTQGLNIVPVDINGIKYYVRIISFLNGTLWAKAENLPIQAFCNLGKVLGQMDKEMNTFSCLAAHRDYEWDLANTTLAYSNLPYIKDYDKRRIVDYFLLQFQAEVQPHLHSLRKSVVHNDVNDYNIFVEDNEVVGIIDFGDMVYTQTVNNLAIACTYAMLKQKEPIKYASAVVRAYNSQFPLTEREVSLIYYLIAARLCISLTKSAWNQAQGSNNEHHFVTQNQVWDLILRLLEINPIKAHNEFRIACGFSPIIAKSDYSLLLEERKSKICKNLSVSYKQPLKIERGALQYLYDDLGNTYIDCVNNVSHVGHCHPVVVRAMQKQIATLNTNTRYLHNAMVDYARELLSTLPSNLQVCYFTNSGSEANDLAIRMARHFNKQNDVIVLDHAYHGTTTLAIELSPYKFDSKNGFGQKSYIHKAENPDQYRGRFGYTNPKAGYNYAQDIQRIMNELRVKNKGIAAFICETLLGVGGQIPLPEGYLMEVYRIVREAGGICIADEVQVGFGRVGERFWGFQLQNVEPDMVVLGKPIGNGHPLAAVITTQEIADSFNNGLEYFNTYGGNPVSMVTGLEVLRTIQHEEMQNHALEVGNLLLGLLNDLKPKHSIIGDVRGKGLFIGVELVKDHKSLEPAVAEIYQIVELMKQHGFLISTDGPLNNVLKIKPHMVFSKQNAIDLVKTLDYVLGLIN